MRGAALMVLSGCVAAEPRGHHDERQPPAPQPATTAEAAGVRPVEARAAVGQQLRVEAHFRPEGQTRLGAVSAVGLTLEAMADCELVLEVSSPHGTVYQRNTAVVRAGSGADVELLVAGTPIELRDLAGVWTATATQGDARAALTFELTP